MVYWSAAPQLISLSLKCEFSAIGIGHFVASRAIAPYLNCTSQKDGDSPTIKHIWKEFRIEKTLTHMFFLHTSQNMFLH